jgi:hypothetical protein
MMYTMDTFNSNMDIVMDELAEHAKAKWPGDVHYTHMSALRTNLHAWAAEEGVQLRINVEPSLTLMHPVYIYLRKNKSS